MSVKNNYGFENMVSIGLSFDKDIDKQKNILVATNGYIDFDFLEKSSNNKHKGSKLLGTLARQLHFNHLVKLLSKEVSSRLGLEVLTTWDFTGDSVQLCEFKNKKLSLINDITYNNLKEFAEMGGKIISRVYFHRITVEELLKAETIREKLTDKFSGKNFMIKRMDKKIL